MKKIVLSCLAVFTTVLTFAQSADLVVIPRLEGVMTKYVSSDKPTYDFGQSSIYADLDGTFKNDAFSYSIEAQLVNRNASFLYDYEAPFTNGTWLNWAYISYDGGFIGGDIGKIVLNNGLFEFEANDWAAYGNLASNAWNFQNVYEYGATLRLTPWENQVFEAQILTSPSMIKLKYGDIAYSFGWKGTFGERFSAKFAYAGQRWTDPADPDHITADERGWTTQIGFGLRYEFDKCSLYVDGTNGPFHELKDWSEAEFTGRFDYTGGENRLCHFGAFFGIQNLHIPAFGGYFEVFPMKDDNLKIYLNFARRGYAVLPGVDETFVSASLGITYRFNLHWGD